VAKSKKLLETYGRAKHYMDELLGLIVTDDYTEILHHAGHVEYEMRELEATLKALGGHEPRSRFEEQTQYLSPSDKLEWAIGALEADDKLIRYQHRKIQELEARDGALTRVIDANSQMAEDLLQALITSMEQAGYQDLADRGFELAAALELARERRR
jgi:hypothetical protein